MNNQIIHDGLFILGLAAVSWLVVEGLVRFILRYKLLLDIPNRRSSHKYPTPFGGGSAITMNCLLGWIGVVPSLPWIVGLNNAHNFMDGIDGIAAGGPF